MRRTRIKVCGLRHVDQAVDTVDAGADAIGLVFYAPSPRAVDIDTAREIAAAVPPFAQLVALFLDAGADEVRAVIDALPIGLLQFHGRETPAFCAQFDRPYIRAVPADAHDDADAFEARFPDARGFLYDSNRAGEAGGMGERFDWQRLQRSGAAPMILAGGLDPDNVAGGVRALRPWAVDVSSGVERAKGEKDPQRVRDFIAAVRGADADRG